VPKSPSAQRRTVTHIWVLLQLCYYSCNNLPDNSRHSSKTTSYKISTYIKHSQMLKAKTKMAGQKLPGIQEQGQNFSSGQLGLNISMNSHKKIGKWTLRSRLNWYYKYANWLPLRSARFLPSSCFHTQIVWSSDVLTNLRLSTAFTCNFESLNNYLKNLIIINYRCSKQLVNLLCKMCNTLHPVYRLHVPSTMQVTFQFAGRELSTHPMCTQDQWHDHLDWLLCSVSYLISNSNSLSCHLIETWPQKSHSCTQQV